MELKKENWKMIFKNKKTFGDGEINRKKNRIYSKDDFLIYLLNGNGKIYG